MEDNVLLLSGGLDSTVLLADQVARGNRVLALSFDYGQTHRKELSAAKNIAEYYSVEHRIVSMTSVVIPSALTGAVEIPTAHAEEPDDTTVPCRNVIFLSIGAAIADTRAADKLLIGANADDKAGYLDCRPMFLNAMAASIKLATKSAVDLSAPYLNKTKAQIVEKGYNLNAPMWLSWSCYRGGDKPCLNCGACQSRTEAGA